jgi:predicted phosphodiesterase
MEEMKVLVIPDIHLKPQIFDYAEKIMNEKKADISVCLMDIADDWNKEYQVQYYAETYDRAIKYSKTFSNTLWCYGNHDISYVWGKLESGYSPYAENTVISKIEELKNTLANKGQLKFIHRIDNVIFCHGGFSKEYVERFYYYIREDDIDDIIAAINSARDDYLWNNESPLWLRPQYEERNAFRREKYTQVVGHTPVDVISEKNGFISTDVFSTYRDGTQIGENAMLIIDSITREYETALI